MKEKVSENCVVIMGDINMKKDSYRLFSKQEKMYVNWILKKKLILSCSRYSNGGRK